MHKTIASDFEGVYRRDHARLVGLATWLIGGRAPAEEIVHDVFVRVVENPPALREPEQLGAYLRSAVVNRCRSRVRRLVLERRHANTARESTEADIDSLSHVRDAVLALPMRQRQAIVLRFYDDLSVDQIAQVLGISSGSVKTHLHRGMRTLESRLEERREP